MGTRSGGIDPGVLMHLRRRAGMNVEQIDALLDQNSGREGVCGVNDFRELCAQLEAGSEAAKLAYDIYVDRLRKYIGAYVFVLGRSMQSHSPPGSAARMRPICARRAVRSRRTRHRCRSRSQPFQRSRSAGDLYGRLADQGSRGADQRRTCDSPGRLAVRLIRSIYFVSRGVQFEGVDMATSNGAADTSAFEETANRIWS